MNRDFHPYSAPPDLALALTGAPARAIRPPIHLTPRELEIVRYVMLGESNKQIARRCRWATRRLSGRMGSSLSGGQKQHGLLARALYRRPDVRFLDEATSHLDIRRENLTNESVRRLPLTRIVIAHRPRTTASADRVIVLEGGAIRQDLRVSTACAASHPRTAGE